MGIDRGPSPTRVHCFETDLASDPVNSVLSPYTWLSSLNYRPKYGWKASGDVGCPPLLDVVVGPATGQTAGGRVRSRRPLCDCPLLGRVQAEEVRGHHQVGRVIVHSR